MTKRVGHLPFRWILPIAQLVLCIAIVWQLWANTGYELFEMGRGPSAMNNESHTINLVIPDPLVPEPQRKYDLLELRLRLPAALNVPVKFIQIPLVLLSRDKAEWAPRNVGWLPAILSFSDIWQAMSWPIIGTVFWWMAGRSLDALLALRHNAYSPRITLIEAAFGISFVLLGSALCVVLAFDSYSKMREYVDAAGGGLWAILGAMMALALVLQWRVQRSAKQLTTPST